MELRVTGNAVYNSRWKKRFARVRSLPTDMMASKRRRPLPVCRFSFWVLVCSLAFAACGGDGGGSAPTAPPPPSPLSWSDVPESATIKVGEKTEILLSLSSAVAATYTHSAGNENVTLVGQNPRAGFYTLEITGVRAGETTVTVTAMVAGYVTATATFAVTVELRPLAWTNLPIEIELEVGDQETTNLQLNALVAPELEVELSSPNVAVSTECVPASCEVTVVGLAAGESVITVTATAEGYTEAPGEIEVFVTDPFQLALWRELVFDDYDCPRADATPRCTRLWGGKSG